LSDCTINASATLKDDWANKMIDTISAKIFSKGLDIEQEFDAIDEDKSGKISYTEFCKALEKYELGLTEDQMYNFMSSIDTDEKGTVSLDEFKERFQPSWEKKNNSLWLADAIKEVSCYIYCTKSKDLDRAFQEIDSNQDSTISYKEFSHIIRGKLGKDYTKEQRREIFDYVDINKDGRISLNEFKSAFKVSDNSVNKWQVHVIEQLCTFLFEYKDYLKKGFLAIDTTNTGLVDSTEFIWVLQSVVKLLPKKKLTLEQIEQLSDIIEKSEHGLINWKNFLDSFVFPRLK